MVANVNDSQSPAGEASTTVDGHRLTLLHGAKDRIDALVALIEGAEERLQFFYYRIADDALGEQVREALLAARARGVTVELLIDRFGSDDTSDNFFAPLRDNGAAFGIFSSRRSTRYLVRNHQKMAIADRRRALIGGFNLDTHYFDDDSENGWCDLGLLVEGDAVERLAQFHDQLTRWCTDGAISLREVRRTLREFPAEQGALRWLIGGPTNRLSPWARSVKRDLDRGTSLAMVEAYFSPGQGLLRRIGRLARRGTARLVMAAKSDNRVTIDASRLLYGYLLRKGAAIFEYRPRKLHMKLIVIDDAVYIGSANFDMRSLFINLEIMLRIEDAGFAEQVDAFIDQLVGDCEAITPEVNRQRTGVVTRVRGFFAYLFVGVLDYTVTRTLNR